MSSSSSNIDAPTSENFDHGYDTDDPLLDYCEDYAWDPSDWDLETEDHRGEWDPSDNNDNDELPVSSPELLPSQTCCDNVHVHGTTKKNVPPQTRCNNEHARGTTKKGNSSHGFERGIYTMLLKYYTVIKKALGLNRVIIIKKWVIFKWLFVVLNVVIEVCQAMLNQENAQGKISTHIYLRSSIVTSACCLMISIFETIQEGKKSKVVWKKRGCFGWFYYPGRQKRMFGRFLLILGLVSATVQLCINLVALVINKNFLKFDTLPLLLSSGYFVAALVDRRGNAFRSKVNGRRSNKSCSRKVKVTNKSFGSNLIDINIVDESNGLISDEFKTIQIIISK